MPDNEKRRYIRYVSESDKKKPLLQTINESNNLIESVIDAENQVSIQVFGDQDVSPAKKRILYKAINKPDGLKGRVINTGENKPITEIHIKEFNPEEKKPLYKALNKTVIPDGKIIGTKKITLSKALTIEEHDPEKKRVFGQPKDEIKVFPEKTINVKELIPRKEELDVKVLDPETQEKRYTTYYNNILETEKYIKGIEKRSEHMKYISESFYQSTSILNAITNLIGITTKK